jgi:SAM-dependent methyltransferase
MVSKEEIIAAYRLILGREPESEEAIWGHMNTPELAQLRRNFLNSDEFQATVVPKARPNTPLPFPIFIDRAGQIQVEVRTDGASLDQILRRVERCWTRLGQTDPHWSVLSTEQYRCENFAQHSEEFYASGQSDVNRLNAWLARNGLDVSKFTSCLELGCGTGRITAWLARQFSRVIACDVSPPHLELASALTKSQGMDNIEFVRVQTMEVLGALSSVDVVFSLIVLQHNPPPMIYNMLDLLLKRLNPGGIAFFQVPTYGLGYAFRVEEYLRGPERSDFEMHLLPQRFIFDLAIANGCGVLEVEPDVCVGTLNWISNTFLLQKYSASK